jgi:hypothetical protein
VRDSVVDARILPLAVSNAALIGTWSNHDLVLRTNNTEVVRLRNNGRVGIGTTDPGAKLTVWGPITVGTNNTFDQGTVQAPFKLVNDNSALGGGGAIINELYSTGTPQPGYIARFARGTEASPLAVAADDRLAFFVGGGYGATQFHHTASVDIFSEEAYTDSARGSYIRFTTTSVGQTARVEKLRITGAGRVGIGVTNPQSTLAVNGYITESTDGGTTYHNVVTQQDVGLLPNQIPLNQYLGQLAFMDTYSPSGLRRIGGGADDLSINTDGFVGLGITTPLQELHIYRSSGNVDIRLQGGANTGYIDIFHGPENYGIWGTSTTSRMSFATSSLERFTILSGGNVGIGTTNPDRKLQVWGANLGATAGDTDTIARFTGLVGNRSNLDILTRRASNGSTWTTSEARLQYNIDDNVLKRSWISFFNASAVPSENAIRFGEATDTEWMRISDGNVGIGTTIPGNKLAVIGTSGALADASIRVNSTANAQSANSGLWITGNQSTAHYNWLIGSQYNINGAFEITPSTAIDGATFSTPAVVVTANRNVGIGITDPSAKLHVAGQAFVTTGGKSGSNTYLSLRSNDANSMELQFGNVTNTAWQIQSVENSVTYRSLVLNPVGGNVGVGTTNPTVKFDVAGAGQFTANGATLNLVGTDHSYIQWYPDGIAAGRKAYMGYPGNTVDHFTIENQIAGSVGHIVLQHGGGGAAAVLVNTATATGTASQSLQVSGGAYISGNVGIGTTNPLALLHVSGSAITNAEYLKVGGTGSTSRYYRYISVPAKTTAGGVSDTAKSVYVGRFYNGTSSLILYLGGDYAEEGLQVTLTRLWGVGSVPVISSLIGGHPAEITFHHQSIDNDSFYLFISYTYNPNALLNASNSIRLDITSLSTIGNFTVGTTPTIPTLNSSNRLQVGLFVGESGRIGVGNNINPTSSFDGYGVLRMSSGSSFEAQIISRNDATDTTGSYFILEKSRNGAVVQDGDGLGTLMWRGMGTAGTIQNSFASIQATAEGTIGAGAIPAGMQISASSKIVVDLNGEKLRINSVGNVGIGTTNPQYKLHIVQNGDTLALESQVDTGRATLRLLTAGSDWEVGARGSASSPANAFYIYDNSVNQYRFVISDTGNIGIGTVSPQRQLHISTSSEANIVFENTSGSTNQKKARIYQTSGTNPSFQMTFVNDAFNTEESFFIASRSSGTTLGQLILAPGSGNVGIGTTNATVKLDVGGETSQFPSSIRIRNTSHATSKRAAIAFGNGASHQILIDTQGNGTENFGIYQANINKNTFIMHQSTGFIGIGGELNPPSQLAVFGYITENTGDGIYYNVVTQKDIGFNPNQIPLNQYLGQLAFQDQYSPSGLRRAGGGSDDLIIDSNGRIGIGTTAPGGQVGINTSPTWSAFNYGANLVISGSRNNGLGILDSTGSNPWFIGNGGGSLLFATMPALGDTTTAANVRVFFANTGNVGIGTTNPFTKLDVFGGDVSIRNIGRPTALEIGVGQNSDQFAYIDLTGDTTYADYGLRIIRNNTGANTPSDIIHRGLGDFRLIANESASIALYTGNTEKLRVTGSGNVGIGTANPLDKLTIWAGTDSGLYTSAINTSTGTSAHTVLKIQAGDAAAYFFINSQGRSADGGIRTATIRNDAGDLRLQSSGSVGIQIQSTTGNVGIGVASPTYKLQVNGSFAATTKSFVIDHPTKPGHKLRYGSLEGPENGVYARGKLSGSSTIHLPEYWTELVDEDSITVNLTPIGRDAALHSVIDISDNTVIVESASGEVNCFYTVFAERKDVDRLVTEYES